MKRVVVSPEKPVQKIKRLPKDYRELKSDENPYIAKLISYIQEKYPYNYVSDNRGNINEALTKRFIAHNLLTDFEDTGDMIQFVKFYASFILSKHGINEIEYYQKSVGLEDSYSTNNYMRENKIHLPLYRFTSSRDIKRLLATMRYIEEDIIYQQNFINGTGLNKKITNPCRFPDRFQVDYANERVRDFFQFLERFVSRPKTVINNETKTYSMDYINSYMIRKNDISQQLAFDSSVSEMNNIYEYLKYVHNNDFVNPAEKEKADSNFEIIKDELFKYNLNSKQQHKRWRESNQSNKEFETMDNMIKEKYYEYCERCLVDEFEIINESAQWELLSQGMKIARYYNSDLAQRLYERCFELGAYKACLTLLDAPKFPATEKQLNELITEYIDEPDFEKNLYEYLINFDKDFLRKSYIKNQTLNQNKDEEYVL